MTASVPAHGSGFPHADEPAHVGAPATPYQQVDPETYSRLREEQRRGAVPALPDLAQAAPDSEPDDRPEPGQHLADLRAEVATENEAAQPAQDDQERPPRDLPDGAVEVPLEGLNGRGIIAILDPRDWSTAANADLRVGDFESWATECLAPGDYEDVWQRLDPRMRHVEAMFQEYRRLTGQDRGKSHRSMAGLRRSARR